MVKSIRKATTKNTNMPEKANSKKSDNSLSTLSDIKPSCLKLLVNPIKANFNENFSLNISPKSMN